MDLGYRDQIQGFAGALAGRGGRVCPLGFGRLVLEITCAAYLAASRGSEVPLPYDGPRDRTPLVAVAGRQLRPILTRRRRRSALRS